jgi:hypothetical protein
MYNSGTQVQIPTDANLGSYYLFKNSLWGSPPQLSFKKKIWTWGCNFWPPLKKIQPEFPPLAVGHTIGH